MLKKLAAILLCLVLFASVFAGCGKDQKKTGSETEAPTVPEEYFLDPEPGTNQLSFYWYADGVDYSTCDMWIWYPNADGRGYLFHPCAYGAKVVLNVPEDISEVGFIVRRNCSDPGGSSWGDATKDFDEDRFAVITGPNTEIYLKPGDGSQYTSTDGGITLSQPNRFDLAAIIALDQIQYFISPAKRITSLDQVKVSDGEREIPVKELSSLNNEMITGVITLEEELDLSKVYSVSIEGFEAQNAVPTKVFDSQAFSEKYTYEGDDLGAIIHGENTTFKVWAPTASAVVLNLFDAGDGSPARESLPMERGEKGVWFLTVPCGHGTYYTYSVTTSLGTQEAVDPYAKAVGVNGDRGMVIDLASTDPLGFDSDVYYSGIKAYNEAVIWEVHVRDFSNTIAGSAHPGKYLAFTETGLTNDSGEPVGMDYLKDLGVTHVHLQPVYDFATVDETKLDQEQFNWGYDPKNYNAPEGSYSTDPYHGEVRVNEFKQMVQAVHANGMAVVMDVVYNHTFDINSCLNKVVPYYYYRYNAKGAPSNGSGCGNETASDRPMFRKYMVDSVSYWAKEYHVDGFRFDLMALHDVETMQAVETAVHEINPNAIIYGEGWTGGTSALLDAYQAKQTNISKITPTGEGIGAVAVFNDVIRDGLKGSVFEAKDQGYINGKASSATAVKVVFGLEGGIKSAGANWSVDGNMVINYMACHDNNTLWDKLLASNGGESDEARFAMNRLGASIILIGKGTPFFLAGEEMLRTKQGDHNSYKSSDKINNLDWNALTEGSLQAQMRAIYRDLIAMRRENAFFTDGEIACEILGDASIRVTWTLGGKEVAAALINPYEFPIAADFPEGSTILFNGTAYDAAHAAPAPPEVPAKSVVVVLE